MLRNYLILAWRNLRRHFSYSLINTAGLALGIACCILMLLYVQSELSFDRFHKKSSHLYRIIEKQLSAEGNERYFPYTMGPLGPALVQDFPEIMASLRIRTRSGMGRFPVTYGQNRFYEGDVIVAEQQFFDFFDFEMLRGNPATALAAPQSVVLTEATARKYFGDENPMGKSLNAGRFGDVTVTGLLADLPAQSHLQFSMIFSFSSLPAQSPRWQEFIDSWESSGFLTYVMAERPIDANAFNQQLSSYTQRHLGEDPQTLRQVSLQPLHDIHFYSGHVEFDENARKGDIGYLYIFSGIALFILLIACINYMNLATARSMKRAREIGMRKVVGAQKRQLILQFLSESLLLSFIALVLAVALVQLLLPSFNALTDRQLSLSLAENPLWLLALVLVALIVGLMAGSYPAFFLSRFQPVTVFKGEVQSGRRAASFRRLLVVTQFALSILMIISTLVAANQLDFIRSKKLGFNKEHILIVDINSRAARESAFAMKHEMRQIPAVQQVALSSRVPGEWKNISEIEVSPRAGAPRDAHTMFFMGIDEDFLSTFEIDLLAGRTFSPQMSTDTSAVLLNETAAQLLGWEAPVGSEVRIPLGNGDGVLNARVIGVVRDFHFQSLHEKINPLVLGHWNNPIYPIDYFSVRLRSGAMQETLAALKAVHERYDSSTPFEFNFLDERVQDFYVNDVRVGWIFGIAAGLAIFIACLGLFGLTAFTVEQRTKEIGVRKVLGATVPKLVMLLSGDFARLVLVSALLAAPVAYLLLREWLQNFAYRIELGPGIFVLAAVLALAIALLTVSLQAIRAAMANPAEVLKYE